MDTPPGLAYLVLDGVITTMTSHTTNTPFVEAHPHALALYCSDGRFTESVEELVRTARGHGRFDVLAIPGGPALLVESSASIVELETMRPASSFLIRSHQIVEAVIIAHEGCGFYKKRYAGAPSERIIKRQLDDLQKASAWISQTHGISVYAYFAKPVGERIRFEPVELTRPR